MRLEPKMKYYEKVFQTIDSHTMGEPTRIIVSGFSDLQGETMMDKKKYLETHYDHYRKALMLEPRGHKDMFGALLTQPVHEEADLGVIFMDSGGYLNMCGHGSIGSATVAVETGLVAVTEPYTEVVLDAPSGIIRTKVKVENGKAVEVSILNVPSFLYKKDLRIEMPGYGEINYDIAFGGSFFVLIDAEKIGLSIEMNHIDEITDLGMSLLQKVNDTVDIKHPYLEITTVDLCEFYCSATHPKADKKNVVIFGGRQADRSPCGTGTSAKLAALYEKGEIKLGEEFVYESITGSMFRGVATKKIEIGENIHAIIPKITGSAYIIGFNNWVIDEEDPLVYGFWFGNSAKIPEMSDKTKIVKAAWKLFHDRGYDQTTEKDIIQEASMTDEQFYSVFNQKQDLVETLADLFDAKYAELILQMSPRLNAYEKLIVLNRELFNMIEKQIPIELLRLQYSSQMAQESKKQLLNKNRLYYRLIHQILEEGVKSGQFKEQIAIDEMASTYAQMERGLIYDWCINNGTSNLVNCARKMIPLILREFLA